MTLRTVDIADAVEPLADYAQRIGDGPVVVTSGGQPVAIVVPVENADGTPEQPAEQPPDQAG